jgi:MFS family permease
MSKALAVVFASSVLFAVLFAAGGAGIYGSPFASVPSRFDSDARRLERRLMLLTILVGPIACLAALLIHRGRAKAASAALVAGATAGAILGSLTRFRVAWEGVFLIFVWSPMVFVALMLLFPRLMRTRGEVKPELREPIHFISPEYLRGAGGLDLGVAADHPS